MLKIKKYCWEDFVIPKQGYNFFKNKLGPTSNFWAPEGLHEAI